MARGRMLSKDISLDEKVNALSDDTARLLFTWLIPHLDVEGRMYGEAQVFKSIVAPRRPYSIKKVEKYLKEMEKLGLIVRYSVNGNEYLFAPNFEKHQVGLRKDRESKSKIPINDGVTTENRRSNDGISPAQVKVKVKVKVKGEKEREEGGCGGEPSPTPLHLNIYNEFINNFNYAFGHQPNAKELAQIRDLSHELAQYNCPEKIIKDALKEAAGYNKASLSYVRAILLDWVGVKR